MSPFDPRSFNAHHFNLRLGLGLGAAIALLLVILLVRLLLPWLLVLAAIAAGSYLWRRCRAHQRHLYTCFYTCLQQQNGRISVLDFAMVAQITGPQARVFLDQRAKDFFADFEPTSYGDVFYTFPKASNWQETPSRPLRFLK